MGDVFSTITINFFEAFDACLLFCAVPLSTISRRGGYAVSIGAKSSFRFSFRQFVKILFL